MTSAPRPLTGDDLPASIALSVEAFGAIPPGAPVPDPAHFPPPGRHPWGTFEEGRLLGRVTSREFHSWWHGRSVPTNGIAAVAVTAEARGRGLLDDLFAAVLAEGLAERGEVVSTLYPTAPGIYRRFGYEVVGSLETVEVPVSALAGLPPADGVGLRRAGPDDVEAVRDLYDVWAAGCNGPLSRRGPSFPATAEEVVDAFTGITLAERDGRLVGWCSWERGAGFTQDSVVEVSDLVAVDAGAARALWRLLGSFSPVTGRVRVQTSGADTARLALPSAHWSVVEQHPYMLRVHDVAAALTGLLLAPPGWRVPEVAFSVAGDLLGVADGDYVLSVQAGVSACVRGARADGGPVLTPRGLAMVWSGAWSCADARAAGQLEGGAPDTDRTLDLLLGGRQVHVRDWF